MNRALGLRVMDLNLHLCSNAMPQYFKQTIRDSQPMGPVWSQKILQHSNSSNRGLPRFFITFESVVLADAKLWCLSHASRLQTLTYAPSRMSNVHCVSLNSVLRPCVTARCWCIAALWVSQLHTPHQRPIPSQIAEYKQCALSLWLQSHLVCASKTVPACHHHAALVPTTCSCPFQGSPIALPTVPHCIT